MLNRLRGIEVAADLRSRASRIVLTSPRLAERSILLR